MWFRRRDCLWPWMFSPHESFFYIYSIFSIPLNYSLNSTFLCRSPFSNSSHGSFIFKPVYWDNTAEQMLCGLIYRPTVGDTVQPNLFCYDMDLANKFCDIKTYPVWGFFCVWLWWLLQVCSTHSKCLDCMCQLHPVWRPGEQHKVSRPQRGGASTPTT